MDQITHEAVACLAGNFQPGFYASDCLSCYAGHYCPDAGMSDIDDYGCNSGYFCLGGGAVANPTNELAADGVTVIGDVCPIEAYCPFNLIH